MTDSIDLPEEPATQAESNLPSGSSHQREFDQAALALYNGELDYVDLVARQLYRSINGLVELEELVSAGREGLVEAALRFEPDYGVPFRAYATYRIRGAMMDAVRKASWLPRCSQERIAAMRAAGIIGEGAVATVFSSLDAVSGEHALHERLDEHLASVATAMALSTEMDTFPVSDGEANVHLDPEASYARKEMLELVREELDSLNVAEAQVIRHLYFEHRSLEDTANALNRQKPWACRLQNRGIEQLTKRLKQRL